ncbi:hypothetical protein MANI_018083 [Metarhizium anisopliae]
MSSLQSSISRSLRPQSSKATSVGSRSGRSSAYGKDFQQHLADYNVHVNNWRSKALNATEMQSELAHERASLSPSQFSDSDFEEFRRKNEDPALESEVITSVPPILCGNSSIHNQQNVLFTELEPITNSGAIQPKPDFFDGACLGDLDQNIRNNEGILSAAIPTKHPNVPVVPNFFLEVQGPDGNASVAQRQACYDGAYGTRAIHALQNYKETEPIYDGNAYTYSSTYYAGTGTLQLYAHHVTAPATVNERPQYHMTQIDGWQMTGNINSFRRGATVFRNARDSAQRYRNHFIQAANAKATQAMPSVQENLNDSTPHNSREDAAYTTLQGADDALQQKLASKTKTKTKTKTKPKQYLLM